jgi:hypothetical protein
MAVLTARKRRKDVKKANFGIGLRYLLPTIT